MTPAKALRLLVGIFFGALFLWLILRQVSAAELRRAFEGARFSFVAAALAAFAAGYACRIERWRLMLKVDNPAVRWSDCAGPLLASFAVNNLVPFRAGDALRSFAFNARLGTGSSVVVATLLVERLLDLLMVLLMLGVVIAMFGVESSMLANVGSTTIIGGAAVILAVLLFPRLLAPLATAFGKLVLRLSPKIGQKLVGAIDKGLSTLEHLSRGPTMVMLVLWSGLAWFAEGCVFWFAALALPSITEPLAGWLALPMGTLATLIPSTPGYVGTFDFFTARAMTLFGNDAGAATAFALLVHVLIWTPPTLVGGLYLLIRPVTRREKIKVVSS